MNSLWAYIKRERKVKGAALMTAMTGTGKLTKTCGKCKDTQGGEDTIEFKTLVFPLKADIELKDLIRKTIDCSVSDMCAKMECRKKQVRRRLEVKKAPELLMIGFKY